MKKKLLLVFSILTVAVLLCSCGKAVEDTSSETNTETVSSATADLPGQVYFGNGVYQVFVNDVFNGDYYIFYDTQSGKTANANTGMGLGFTCEQTDGQVTFHMGSSDDTTVMKMSGEYRRYVGTTEQNDTYTFIWTPEDPETFDATDAGIQRNTDGDTQNPIMNFIGDYSNGRAIMTILPDGNDGAKITVSWAGSVSVTSTWVMSGKCVLDETTLTVAYNDCVETTRIYKEDGSVQSETVEYENGSGKITINLANSNITWTDDQENVAKDYVFTWIVRE